MLVYRYRNAVLGLRSTVPGSSSSTSRTTIHSTFPKVVLGRTQVARACQIDSLLVTLTLLNLVL